MVLYKNNLSSVPNYMLRQKLLVAVELMAEIRDGKVDVRSKVV